MTDTIDFEDKPKKKRGRFLPGQSGNPAGRPPGIPNRMAQHRQQLYEAMPGILDALIANAQAGDSTAIKLLLERTLPPLKSGYATVTLPVESDSLVEYGRATLKAVAQGKLAPDAATTVLQGLAAQAKLIETQELMDRITALEATLRQRNEP